MRKTAWWTGGLGLALMLGCNPMDQATMAYQAAKGADADLTPIRQVAPAKIAAFKSIRLGEVKTDVPPIVGSEVLAKVRKELQEQLGDRDVSKIFPGGGKTLRVDVICRFYKGKGVIGGEGRLDWLVMLVDAESGENVGVVFVEGVSQSPLEHGASDMAKENAKKLIKFLEHYKQGKSA